MTQLKDLSLTSDREYLKIYKEGTGTLDATGSVDPETTLPKDAFGATYSNSVTIYHGLGYVPLVKVYWDPMKNGRWWQSHSFPDSSLGLFPYQEVDPYVNVIVDTTTIKIIMASNRSGVTAIPYIYRIYDIGNVAATSDSPIDKIFQKGSGSATASAAGGTMAPSFTIVTIPHDHGYPPVFDIQFSEDGDNFYTENQKIIGPPDTGSGPPGGPYSRYFYSWVYGYSDANNLYIILVNVYTYAKTIYYRYTLGYMSKPDKIIIDSDLDAYKNAGQIKTASLTISGTLGAGAAASWTTSLTATSPDMGQMLFDNSIQHFGRFKSMTLVPYTMVDETTNNSLLLAIITQIINGNDITIKADVTNPYAGAVNLQTTTLNFRYIPFEATF